MKRKLIITVLYLTLLIVLTACVQEKDASKKQEVTIGYFPNLTHIVTIIALENDYFTEEFGKEVKIRTKTVNNGGLFMEAMVTKSIDVGTVGPGPVINFYVKNPNYHIISGAVNGGAVLITSDHSNINKLKDLDGKRVAIPVIGGTQDIMLRKALEDVNLKPTTNGGTVELFAAAPADTATLFIQKSVDATAVPEPWGHVLETQAKGKLLLDWESFAWGKESPNTVVAASNDFLKNEAYAEAYLTAHVKAVEFIKNNPGETEKIVIKHIKEITGKEMDKEEVKIAFSRLEATTSVNEQVIEEMVDIILKAEYIQSDDIKGLVELKYLKSVLDNN